MCDWEKCLNGRTVPDLRTVDVGVVMMGDAGPVLVMEMLLGRLLNQLVMNRVEAACVHRHPGKGDRRRHQNQHKSPQHEAHEAFRLLLGRHRIWRCMHRVVKQVLK